MLDHALRLGRAPVVQRLVRAGAYPYRSGERKTPPERRRLDAIASAHGFADEAAAYMRRALRAAAARDDPRAARGLLLHGCEPEAALLYALVRKRRAPRIVRALLAAGADPNYADEMGTHLLALSTLQGDEPMVRALLAARADPTLEEESRQSILALARTQAADAGPAVSEMVALMEHAVEAQAGAEARDASQEA